jgi:hypothetical protein
MSNTTGHGGYIIKISGKLEGTLSVDSIGTVNVSSPLWINVTVADANLPLSQMENILPAVIREAEKTGMKFVSGPVITSIAKE